METLAQSLSSFSVTIPLAAIFLSIVYLYSGNNPRLTEDCTHALWNTTLFFVCRNNLDKLFVTPQLRLWEAPSELAFGIDTQSDDEQTSIEFASGIPFDPLNEEAVTERAFDDEGSDPNSLSDQGSVHNISQITIPKSKKTVDVIPDYAVLLPVIKLRYKLKPPHKFQWLEKLAGDALDLTIENPNPPIARLLDVMTHVFPCWSRFTTKKTSIPLLAELKRPVSRHKNSVMKYGKDLRSAIEVAQLQVVQQAQCLFLGGMYAHQNEVLLIAAVGDFFTFRGCTRDSFGTESFDASEYDEISCALDQGKRQTVSLEEYTRKPEDLESGLDSEGSQTPDDATQIRRSSPKLVNLSQATSARTALNEATGMRPSYHIADLNLWLKYDRIISLHENDEDPDDFDESNYLGEPTFLFQNPGIPDLGWIVTDLGRVVLTPEIVGSTQWSPIFKIGTTPAFQALLYISEQLDIAAKKAWSL